MKYRIIIKVIKNDNFDKFNNLNILILAIYFSQLVFN